MRSSWSCSYLIVAISSILCTHATPLSTSPISSPWQRSPFLLAPVIEADHPYGTLNNSYIVVFKDDVSHSLMSNHFDFLARAHHADLTFAGDSDAGLRHVYDGPLKGYSGRFSGD